jgi:hypothetical protein
MRATIKIDENIELNTIVPQSVVDSQSSLSKPQGGSGLGGTPATHWIGLDSLKYRKIWNLT